MVQRNYKTITQQDSAIERALRCNIVIITSYDYLKSPSSVVQAFSLYLSHTFLYVLKAREIVFLYSRLLHNLVHTF